MALNRTKPAGWGTGEKLTSAQLNQLDIDHALAVDKAGGDTITGTLVLSGASGKVRTTAGGRLELADNDFPLLATGHTGRSRTIVVPTRPAANGVFNAIYSAPGTPGSPLSMQSGYVAPLATPLGFHTMTASPAYPIGYLVDVTAHMHNGATLASAVLSLMPSSTHVALPTGQPSFGIYRITPGFDWSNTPIPAPNSLGSPTFAQLAYAGAVGGYAGVAQTLTFTPTANNVIDRAAYAYIAFLWDEYGSNTVVGNRFSGLTLNFTNILDTRFA